MEHLFTPWRFSYVTSEKPTRDECVLCRLAGGLPADDRENLVLLRGDSCYVVLNRYPYTNGHLMVVPYDHVARLSGGPDHVLAEMILLAARCEAALERAYRPAGFNLGMNLGRAGGAGIAGHLHFHVVPRWTGDTNFMTVTAETRVLPRSLEQAYDRLRPELAGEGSRGSDP